jgi:hypothetical protein
MCAGASVCAQHAARLGIKNRLMPRELAASATRSYMCILNDVDKKYTQSKSQN